MKTDEEKIPSQSLDLEKLSNKITSNLKFSPPCRAEFCQISRSGRYPKKMAGFSARI